MSKKDVPLVDEPSTNIETFDFTVLPMSMDAKTEWAYGQLRRLASERSDPSLLPNGKIMTRIEVEELLGREIGEADVAKQCCV